MRKVPPQGAMLVCNGYRWETASLEETLSLGEALGRSLEAGLAIGLVGSLGAGKTAFVKGIAAGNAIGDVPEVTSPTFTLVHEYPGRVRLVHVDLYRLGSAGDAASLGLDEWLNRDCVVVVEWADRIHALLGDERLHVELTPTGETSRRFVFHAVGEAACRCLDTLRTSVF